MAEIAVKRITNANCYLNGNSLLGKVEETKLPEVATTMVEHKALGLVGKIELPSGIDKMEMSMKFNSFYEDALLKAGNPFAPVDLQVRCSRETYTGQGRTAQEPVVTFLKGSFKNYPLGGFKQHENVEAEFKLNITYVKQVIAGKDILEIDVLNNIYKVGGVEILADYRSNIGG